ncbi:EAL domain-containing protein [Pelomonas sp. CA6]|uniref:EAL domain-containing protein n=1 Tax=Pelomonas sp. CA6 TaxID=2907999 RepID=UPI001F4BFA53|nr:EAL domain-containing protein [Pelomonas sp. CA6]MCH7345772.1 EAL domain-containing protein [Pelomonas sp. CA6]
MVSPDGASYFVPFEGTPADCAACARGDKLGFHFDFAYQPIVDLARREVYAREALVRGPAGEPAREVLSQVTHDNRYRFDQACRVKAIKRAAELGLDEHLSINFLPNAIYRPEICIRTTLEAARSFGFPVQRIIFEVTEGERVQDGPWFAAILREYKRIGFQTAIDDFGAGYAGLKLLADFTPDLIKLDMDLVRGIDADPTRRHIVNHLVRLCADLRTLVIAEGVETAGERDALADLGITLMQGFFFARPQFRGLAEVEWGPT